LANSSPTSAIIAVGKDENFLSLPRPTGFIPGDKPAASAASAAVYCPSSLAVCLVDEKARGKEKRKKEAGWRQLTNNN
jgi:hypothetical protein